MEALAGLGGLGGGPSFNADDITFTHRGAGCQFFCCIRGNVDNDIVIQETTVKYGGEGKKADGLFKKLCCCCKGEKKEKRAMTVGEYKEWYKQKHGEKYARIAAAATMRGLSSSDTLTVHGRHAIDDALRSIAEQQKDLQRALKQLSYQKTMMKAKPLSDFSEETNLTAIARTSIDVQVKKSDGSTERFSGRVIKFTLQEKVPTVDKLSADQELEIIGAVKKHLIDLEIRKITSSEIHDLVVRQLKTMGIELEKPEWYNTAKKETRLDMPVNLPRRGSLDDLTAEEFQYLVQAREYYASRKV